MSTKTAARRRAHYEALIAAAPTHRQRINHAADWARAAATDLPTHVRDEGLDRFRRLARDLEEMGDRDDGQ